MALLDTPSALATIALARRSCYGRRATQVFDGN
jgi:hypothetical protein